MASLSEAYTIDNFGILEGRENPQAYNEPRSSTQHPKESRHILGLVGGNQVARNAGNMTDLESDLLGITRPNSDSTERHHLPPKSNGIVRTNPKINISIDATPIPLKEYQMWAYPSVLAPIPLEKQTCSRPEKY